MTASKLPTGLHVREYKGRPFYEGKWSSNGRQVKRRIGPAHLVPDGAGGWKRKRGRVPHGSYDQKAAELRRAELIREYDREQKVKPGKREATFADAADSWVDYLSRADRSKPSTLADYRNLLAQPGTPKARGKGELTARIMRKFGDRRLRSIDTSDIEEFLTELEREGLSNRLINKHRAVLQTLFNYCGKPTAFGLSVNPVSATEKRREIDREDPEPFTPEEVGAIVRAAENGSHRADPDTGWSEEARAGWQAANQMDAALFEVAALTGMRQAELLALRWRDLDFQNARITIARSVSNGQITTPKSGKVRVIPMPDTAARRFDQLSRRPHFTGRNDLVFGNPDGQVQNRSALLRRFKSAQSAAGVEQRRFHDLRHSFLTWTAGAGFASREVQEFAGHSSLRTTDRYLHYRPQRDAADRIEAIYNPEQTDPAEQVTQPAPTK